MSLIQPIEAGDDKTFFFGFKQATSRQNVNAAVAICFPGGCKFATAAA
jgi:hypothetical protein